MFRDPIVEDIHQTRKKVLAEVGDDWEALQAYFQTQGAAERLVDPAEVRRQGRAEQARNHPEA